jgi:hypothetical protein
VVPFFLPVVFSIFALSGSFLRFLFGRLKKIHKRAGAANLPLWMDGHQTKNNIMGILQDNKK